MSIITVVRDASLPRFTAVRCARFAAAVLISAYLLNGNPAVSQNFLKQRQPPAFDLKKSDIPIAEIHDGGPGKDGIPAITSPEMIPAGSANYLKETERVIGVALDKKASAFPLRILNYHEVVNAQMGNTPIRVTYCPLCDSAVVFDGRINGRVVDFGVSGLLYNSNVLIYDRLNGTESLWSQLMTKGVSGPSRQVSLKTLPLELTTWKDWKSRYPEGTVMSLDTGYDIDYSRNPYEAYFSSPKLMFPVNRTDRRLPAKAPVLGLWSERVSLAVPVSVFKGQDRTIAATLDGKTVKIAYQAESRSLRVEQSDLEVQWAYALWFAWYAFHPDTKVFTLSNP